MRESGSALLPVAAVIAVAAVAAMLALGAGRMLIASHQAQLAADAAALGAAAATFDSTDPTAEAEALASINGAELRSCDCPPDRSGARRSVWVVVALEVDAGVLGHHVVRAEAGAEFDPLG